ncbi:T9SS type A sorting domain-containing protein [Aquimarina spinulae]|uniref:T9SS type A sorting domain-containing protein n=1 Tax=Aquimarina spinulae TaxID=1192023 RepID=UPI000D55790F|nr:T9SS type A sorting domain-containing protein [Aquimarina spinulae]
MTKFIQLLLFVLFINCVQAQKVYEDFNSNTAQLQWIASNGVYALEGNPENSQSQIGAYTKSPSHPYSLFFASINQGINLTTFNQIRIKIYSSSLRSFTMKLEGNNGAIEKTTMITEINKWIEYEFDFSDGSSITGLNKIILFFDPGSNRGEKFYFDDIVAYTAAQANTQIVDTFEIGGTSWNSINGVFNTVNNPQSSQTLNTSATCGLFTKNSAAYSFVSTTIGTIDYSTHNELQIKILQNQNPGNDQYTRFTVKLENSVTQESIERRGFIGNTNTWTTYSFDFSSIPQNTTYDKLLIFFGHNDTSNTNSFYFDDVLFRTKRTYPANIARTLDQLTQNSYEVFKLLRTNKGAYRDAKLISNNNDYHPGSTASTGMGLIALCIANEKNWEPNAPDLVIKTLETMTGHTSGFNLDTNASGFARHFFDLNNGARAWNSEYSTIDTAILMSGALFAKEYFLDSSVPNRATTQQKTRITTLVNQLWNSITWDEAIENPTNGTIYRDLDSAGKGVPGTTTLPYNEYIIVADLIHRSGSTSGIALWDKFYKNPYNTDSNGQYLLPRATATYTTPNTTVINNETLTDSSGNFVSSFLVQFSYYLIHDFASNTSYVNYMKNAKNADKNWWKYVSENQYYSPITRSSFEWGTGAGAANAKNGYHADKIYNNDNDNWTKIVSPHIIAGFLPVDQNDEIKNDILNLYKSGKGIYTLPNASQTEILWRYSKEDINWKAETIQGVDFSTMLFGLYHIEDPGFFKKYNNYTITGSPPTNSAPTNDVKLRITFDNYPEETTWEIKDANNVVIHSGGPYGSQTDGSTLNITKTLDEGCYNLVFKDTYGDGICCSYGIGSYELTNSASGAVLASGGSFTSEDIKNFCLGDTTTHNFNAGTKANLETFDISIHPIPAKDFIIIRMNTTKDSNYRIINHIGQMVKKGEISENRIELSGLPDGMYFFSAISNDKKLTKKFIIKQ